MLYCGREERSAEESAETTGGELAVLVSCLVGTEGSRRLSIMENGTRRAPEESNSDEQVQKLTEEGSPSSPIAPSDYFRLSSVMWRHKTGLTCC